MTEPCVRFTIPGRGDFTLRASLGSHQLGIINTKEFTERARLFAERVFQSSAHVEGSSYVLNKDRITVISRDSTSQPTGNYRDAWESLKNCILIPGTSGTDEPASSSTPPSPHMTTVTPAPEEEQESPPPPSDTETRGETSSSSSTKRASGATPRSEELSPSPPMERVPLTTFAAAQEQEASFSHQAAGPSSKKDQESGAEDAETTVSKRPLFAHIAPFFTLFPHCGGAIHGINAFYKLIVKTGNCTQEIRVMGFREEVFLPRRDLLPENPREPSEEDATGVGMQPRAPSSLDPLPEADTKSVLSDPSLPRTSSTVSLTDIELDEAAEADNESASSDFSLSRTNSTVSLSVTDGEASDVGAQQRAFLAAWEAQPLAPPYIPSFSAGGVEIRQQAAQPADPLAEWKASLENQIIPENLYPGSPTEDVPTIKQQIAEITDKITHLGKLYSRTPADLASISKKNFFSKYKMQLRASLEKRRLSLLTRIHQNALQRVCNLQIPPLPVLMAHEPLNPLSPESKQLLKRIRTTAFPSPLPPEERVTVPVISDTEQFIRERNFNKELIRIERKIAEYNQNLANANLALKKNPNLLKLKEKIAHCLKLHQEKELRELQVEFEQQIQKLRAVHHIDEIEQTILQSVIEKMVLRVSYGTQGDLEIPRPQITSSQLQIQQPETAESSTEEPTPQPALIPVEQADPPQAPPVTFAEMLERVIQPQNAAPETAAQTTAPSKKQAGPVRRVGGARTPPAKQRLRRTGPKSTR